MSERWGECWICTVERVAVKTAKNILEKHGIEIEIVSIGSTPTVLYSLKNSGDIDGITEVRPGCYVFYDAMQQNLKNCQWEDCALFVLATVISQPAENRVIIDAGSKTLNLDKGVHSTEFLSGYGYLANIDGHVEALSEEHGKIILNNPHKISINSPVIIIPNHVCSAVNLHDFFYFVGANGAFEKLPVDARGKIFWSK